MKRSSCFAFSVLICATALCEESAAESPPTFSKHIVYAKCADCHRDGHAAPFTLHTYEQVEKRAKQIAEVTGDHVMPPWHADLEVTKNANDCTPFNPGTVVSIADFRNLTSITIVKDISS